MPAVAITALCDPVAIVHIPISLADLYTTKIYWTLDSAERSSREFFNITSNRIEMAIFGSLELITQEWANLHDPDVLINATWRVFEISSGDEGDVGNYDSPHLRHVSAPLARAGISILYQSSYFTDFLLVKASDFEKAASLFAQQGWHLDRLTPAPAPAPSPTPPTPPTPRSALSPAWIARTPPLPPQPELTVLPNPLACVGLSPGAGARLGERVRKFFVWPERAVGGSAAGGGRGRGGRVGSGSGSGSALGMGGAVHGAEAWSGERGDEGMEWEGGEGDEGEGRWESETEVSDLVTPVTPHPAASPPHPVHSAHPAHPARNAGAGTRRPFISYTRNEDGASLMTEVPVLRAMFAGDEDEVQSGGELGWGASADDDDDGDDGDDDDEGERWGKGMGWGLPTPLEAARLPLGMGVSVSMSVGLVGELGQKTHRKTHSDSLPPSPPYAYASHAAHAASASMPGTTVLLSAISAAAAASTLDIGTHTHTHVDVDVDVDVDLSVLPIRWSSARRESRRSEGKGTKRCLQLDLRGFGDGEAAVDAGLEEAAGKGVYHLDKSGLVTRFSSLLASSHQPVRMLYSSTFHTANILVESRDVAKAKRLLGRGRRRAEW